MATLNIGLARDRFNEPRIAAGDRPRPLPLTPAAAPWTERKWALLLPLMIGSGLTVSDASLVGMATPHILASFSVSLSSLTWVAAAFTMAMMITASMTGWLSDRLGRKRLFMYAIGLYVLGSLLSGLAPSFEVMLLTRILQGLGGGPLPPLANAILLSKYAPEERASIISLYLIGPGIGMAFGPVFAGWFIETCNWRWAFFLNLPFGVLALFLASRVLADAPNAQRGQSRIDLVGLGLLIAALVALQMFLLRGPREQWFASSFIVATGLIAIVCLAGLIYWECRAAAPVINLRVFRNGAYVIGFCLIFLYGMSYFGNPYILPLYLQKLRGLSALQAGLLLLPQALVALVLTPVIGRLYNRLGSTFLISAGMLMVAGGYVDLAQLQLDTSGARMLPGLIVTGIGLACLRAAVVPAATQTLPASLMGVASSLIVVGRRIGGNIAYAIVATQVVERSASHRFHLMEQVTPATSGASELLARLTTHLVSSGMSAADAVNGANRMLYQLAQKQSHMQAYNDVFLVSGILFAVCAPLVMLIAWRNRTAKRARAADAPPLVYAPKAA